MNKYDVVMNGAIFEVSRSFSDQKQLREIVKEYLEEEIMGKKAFDMSLPVAV